MKFKSSTKSLRYAASRLAKRALESGKDSPLAQTLPTNMLALEAGRSPYNGQTTAQPGQLALTQGGGEDRLNQTYGGQSNRIA
jgi:hypothetical protein